MTTKILWHSNAPHVPSGYGNQTKVFTPRIRDLGYDVAISAFHGARGTHFSWEGMTVYPPSVDPYGSDILTPHALHHFRGGDKSKTLRDGLIVTLLDMWVLPPTLFEKSYAACWVPIDHDPLPPRVADWFKAAPAVTPIAMSKFGQVQLQEALGPERFVAYVPHGLDTSVFKPLGDDGREDARRLFGVDDDTFVVGMVAANQYLPSRKSIPEAIDAFAQWKRRTNANAVLYLHMENRGALQGVNIPNLLNALGLTHDDVRMVPQYEYLTGELGDGYMVKAYNAFDVLLAPSRGEGFGIPILEAQACGCPVITTDMTACREVGHVGWQVGGQRVWTDQESWQVVPSVEQIVMSLDDAYRGMAYRKRGAARDFAVDYDADLILKRDWEPLLGELFAKIAAANQGSYLLPEQFGAGPVKA